MDGPEIILSQISQAQRDKGYKVFGHIWKLVLRDICIFTDTYMILYTHIHIYM
jgi:hypothetical protein